MSTTSMSENQKWKHLENYWIGFFDDLEQLYQVWNICQDANMPMCRDAFTYTEQSVEADSNYEAVDWTDGTKAGLSAGSRHGPSFMVTGLGFTCVGDGPYKLITPQLFINRFGEKS